MDRSWRERFPLPVSAASLHCAALGYKPFYDKLNVAAIGCGGQGGVILNDAARTENIVALCDVDWNRGAANLKKFEKAAKYRAFRVMLDKQGANIDSCTIETSVPQTLSWDLWLGAASYRPFSTYYVPYNWRGFLDFGTGQIGNWATHTAGPVQTALQLGAPLAVNASRPGVPPKSPRRSAHPRRRPGAGREDQEPRGAGLP